MENIFLNFYLGPFLKWFPIVAWGAVFLYGAGRYASERGIIRSSDAFLRAVQYRALARIALCIHFLYASFLTLGQYFTWRQDSFGRGFLNSPLSASLPISLVQKFPFLTESKLGYFIFYSWGHFWLVAAVSVAVAWAFKLFLDFLKRHRERFFEDGETELGFLCALVAGWPQLVLFIPLVFLVVIGISLIRSLVYREAYTTLGIPFILALIFTVLIWRNAASAYGLGVLNI